MSPTIDLSVFLALVQYCASGVAPGTAQALVQVESAFNPFAIGVVGGTLQRQPRNKAEAIATAKALQSGGWNFSAGLGQINSSNFRRLGLSTETAFDPCTNLSAMHVVLSECHERALRRSTTQAALRMSLSCYYSGNFSTGFERGYVRRVVRTAAQQRPMTSP